MVHVVSGRVVWIVVAFATLSVGQTECNRPAANTNLSALELDAGAGNLVVGFTPATTVYDLSVAPGTDVVSVRAVSADAAAAVTINYLGTSYPLGLGGGETDVPLTPGSSSLVAFVSAAGGATKSYWLNVDTCGGCDDGNPCTDDRCSAEDSLCDNHPLFDLAACDFGGLSGVCLAGVCESECVTVDCGDGDPCTDDVCDPATLACSNDASPDGTVCDSGYDWCQSGACTPIPAGAWTTQTQVVTAGCASNFNLDQVAYPFELTVRTTPISGGSSTARFAAEASGTFVIPEILVDGAVIAGYSTEAVLASLIATAQVRSGATGPNLMLEPDVGAITPGELRFCQLPTTRVCSEDADCDVPPCHPPILVIELPTSTDCGVGGVCDALGKGDSTPRSQCDQVGFCATGDLLVPLAPAIGIYDPAPSGDVLFGWIDDDVPGLATCPSAGPECQETFMPDGCFDLPRALPLNPAEPFGARLEANFSGSMQCAGATRGGICASGEGCLVDADCASAPCTLTDNVVCPTPDDALISFPIQ